MLSIFDFDRTVTNIHSFQDTRIENDEPTEGWYNLGKKIATQGGIRENIALHLEHDANNLSAIATFHNNPAFVAGCIAHTLGKELTLVATHSSSGTPPVAIAEYKIEGAPPFLISYLPYVKPLFKTNMSLLGNKNSQIEFVRSTLLGRGLITESDVIQFYDDSRENYEAASQLLYIQSNLVNGKAGPFIIEETFLAKFQIPSSQFTLRAYNSVGNMWDGETVEHTSSLHRPLLAQDALDLSHQQFQAPLPDENASLVTDEPNSAGYRRSRPVAHRLENDMQAQTNISMAVLNGFIAVAGIAAIAVAFAVFNAAALNPVGLGLAAIGAVSALVGVGLFAKNMRGNQSDEGRSFTPSFSQL